VGLALVLCGRNRNRNRNVYVDVDSIVDKGKGKGKGLRKVFGPKRDEVTGEWRKLHNEELNDLYSSPNIVRVVK
jgi:hypothetical protein